jgi:GTPase
MKKQKTEQIVDVENDAGSIEYKRRLVGLSESRINHLITQMKYRLNEGNNTATYLIGIDDDGSLYQMDEAEMSESINTFKRIAEGAKATIISLNTISTKTGHYLKIYIENRFDICPEIRIAFVGNSGVGKTTIKSVLLYGNLDDGCGKAKDFIPKHIHELDSGCTSSITYDFIGVLNNTILNYKTTKTSNDIISKSEKLITLIDLPGNKKYMKTTLYGIGAYKPHHIFYVIDDADFDCYFYIELLNNINIPWTLLVNKFDMIRYSLSKYEKKFNNMIKYEIGSELNILNKYYITTSTIIKDGLDDLKDYIINMVKCDDEKKEDINESNNIEFMINEVYDLKDMGIIINGILVKGILKPFTKLYLNKEKIGLVNQPNFAEVIVTSIHKQRLPHNILKQDEMASIMVNIDYKYIELLGKQSWLFSDPDYCDRFKNSVTIELDRLTSQHQGLILCTNNYIGAAHINTINNNIAELILFKPIYVQNEIQPIILKNSEQLIYGVISESCDLKFFAFEYF